MNRTVRFVITEADNGLGGAKGETFDHEEVFAVGRSVVKKNDTCIGTVSGVSPYGVLIVNEMAIID